MKTMKPCPFCGAKPTLCAKGRRYPLDPNVLYSFECASGGCGVSFKRGSLTKDGAKRKWNKRMYDNNERT